MGENAYEPYDDSPFDVNMKRYGKVGKLLAVCTV
jgi:hypothetical protein